MFTYIIGLPPKSLVKKLVPTVRSSPSSSSTAVSTGKAATISTLVHRAVQVNTGIFIRLMPGARILMMVTSRLMPDSKVPTPAICKAQM